MASTLDVVVVLKRFELLEILFSNLRSANEVLFADINRNWHFADLINTIKRRFHVSWIRPILDILLEATSLSDLRKMVHLLD